MGDKSGDRRRRSERLLTKQTAEEEVTIIGERLVPKEPTAVASDRPRPLQPRPTRKGQPFVCPKCLTETSDDQRCGGSSRRRRATAGTTRRYFDARLKTWLRVCRKCARRLTATTTSSADKSPAKTRATEDRKRLYQDTCRTFGQSLAQLLADPSADRLYCPYVKTTGTACACLQRHVIGAEDDDMAAKKVRAQRLMDLLTVARRLSAQKCYSVAAVAKSGEKIGLGNGHRKSEEYERFVADNRQVLRNEYGLCEMAAQRVLYYSNNFLHKRLRTEPNGAGGGGQRVHRQRGRAATGRLVAIAALGSETCCAARCVRLGQTHGQLLDGWRQRATGGGQLEARRVLAEMLTPTQGSRANCYKFISLVTGCSYRTIDRVNDYMRSNGGRHEPQEHGLKRFWSQKPVVERQNTAHEEVINEATAATVSGGHETEHPMGESSVPATPVPQHSVLGTIVPEFSFVATSSGGVDGRQQLTDNQTIHLLVDKTSNEISVINGGAGRQMIAILSPHIDFFGTAAGSEHTIQLPVSLQLI